MTVHILKVCVGVETVEQLKSFQDRRFKEHGMVWHLTRHAPRRRDEVLDGGSIFWIIRRAIRVRQRILEIDQAANANGEMRCRLQLDRKLVRTEAPPRRPHQGWRYLEVADAPPDLAGQASGRGRGRASHPPPEMAAELRELGLL